MSEFDISNLPHGRVINAKISGQVGANNSADSGRRKHLVELYEGNGVIDLSDFDSPGSEAGRFEHASGATTDFNYDVTVTLQNLLDNKLTHAGLRVTPLNNMNFDGLSSGIFPPKLTYEIIPANVHVFTAPLCFDATVRKEGSDPFVLNEADKAMYAEFSSPYYDRRSIFEYDLSGFPFDGHILDALITISVNGVSSSQPMIYGYVGNGVAEVEDAFRLERKIGHFPGIFEPGQFTTELDVSYVRSLMESGDPLGVTMTGRVNGASVWFASVEGYDVHRLPPATLKIYYTTTPWSADFNEDQTVDSSDLSYILEAFGRNIGGNATNDGVTDGSDFLRWQRERSSNVSSLHIPEPDAALWLVIAALVTRRWQVA